MLTFTSCINTSGISCLHFQNVHTSVQFVNTNNIYEEYILSYKSQMMSKINFNFCFFPDGRSTGGTLLLENEDKKFTFIINKHTSYIDKF